MSDVYDGLRLRIICRFYYNHGIDFQQIILLIPSLRGSPAVISRVRINAEF
ncbi:MAG: hypothetical protein V7K56_32680 [Nostoc sp.]